MNTVLSQMPGYRVQEYMVVINPPASMREKLDGIKQEFKKNHPGVQINGGANLLLVKFSTWEMMEEKIVQRLKIIGMAAAPFKIQLKDYGSFPSHTIYINITSVLPVKELVRELKSIQRLMKSPAADPHFPDEQHFTIAARLNHVQYEKAWSEYAHRHFTGSFIADSMLLLKKVQGEKRFQVVERFDFMNLPVGIRQGELF